MSNLAILKDATATGASETHRVNTRHLSTDKSFHVVVAGSGAVSAQVRIEVSNDGAVFLYNDESTVSISGTDTAAGACYLFTNWEYIRAYVVNVSGTNAKVSVIMGS